MLSFSICFATGYIHSGEVKIFNASMTSASIAFSSGLIKSNFGVIEYERNGFLSPAISPSPRGGLLPGRL